MSNLTEQEQEQLLFELKTFLHANNTTKGEKPPKKGLFSKVVVAWKFLFRLSLWQ